MSDTIVTETFSWLNVVKSICINQMSTA